MLGCCCAQKPTHRVQLLDAGEGKSRESLAATGAQSESFGFALVPTIVGSTQCVGLLWVDRS